MKKSWLAGASLSVIAAVAVTIPAVRGDAIEEQAPDTAICAALTQEIQRIADQLKQLLSVRQPAPPAIPDLINGLGGKAWSLFRLDCLPPLELPATQAATVKQPPLPTLPAPTASVVPPISGLPTVSACTDLAADLMSAVSGLRAALLSTAQPDLAAALDAATRLVDTLTALTGAADNCLPAGAPAKH